MWLSRIGEDVEVAASIWATTSLGVKREAMLTLLLRRLSERAAEVEVSAVAATTSPGVKREATLTLLLRRMLAASSDDVAAARRPEEGQGDPKRADDQWRQPRPESAAGPESPPRPTKLRKKKRQD